MATKHVNKARKVSVSSSKKATSKVISTRPHAMVTPQSNRVAGLYSNPYAIPHYGDFRLRPRIVEDTSKSVDASSRANYVSLSRQLFAQMAVLNFALELICDWAIGNSWDVIYQGADKDFRNSFEDYANNTWAKNCNILGPTYNLKNTLKLMIREIIRDGDLLQLYTFNRAGLPQLQYVRSHRIGNRTGKSEIDAGRYSGYAVDDGLVKNSIGTTIAYYIQDLIKEEDDYIVSIKDSILCFKPLFFDFQRGVAPVAAAILDGLSVQELDDSLQRRLKVESLVALKIMNKSGEALPNSTQQWPVAEDIVDTVAPMTRPIGVQVMNGGIKYIETGGDISTLSSQTPNVEASSYIAGLETKLLSSIGVPHQLLFSPTDISRAPARGISEIFKKTIASNQALVEQFIYPAVVWAIGIAINDGLLTLPANGEKWFNYIGFTKPKEFSLDQYNEAKIDMEQYKLGLVTRDSITTRNGNGRGIQVVAERKQETIELFTGIVEARNTLQAAYPKELADLSLIAVQNNMQLLTANPVPEPPVTTSQP